MREQQTFLNMIKEHPQIIRYRKLEQLINQNKELKEKLTNLKTTQKQMINAEKIEKKGLINSFKEQYESQLNEIESYPLISEYLALQSDLNEMIQYVLFIFEKGFNIE